MNVIIEITIILLILKIFTKIVPTVEIIMKKMCKE